MSEPQSISAEDLALYAMQALSAEEMAALATRLRNDPAARQELAALQGDLALLSLSAEQQAAPAGSFERLMMRARHEQPAPSAEAEAAMHPMSRTANLVSMRRGKWSIAIPWAVAAALAVACALLGARISSLNEALEGVAGQIASLAAKASRAQQVYEVLNAPNAQRVTLTAPKTRPAPIARATYLVERGALILQADNLKPLPADRAYELWVLPANGSAPIAAGTFTPNDAGYATVVLPKLPAGVAAKGFGVTIEKAEGSPVPTSPIILAGE
jgi:anti-sigma-K factor RskA